MMLGSKGIFLNFSNTLTLQETFLTNCIAVGLGGFIGATLRYLVGLIPVCETTLFPVKTFFINIAGCIAIALVAMLASEGSISNPKFTLFLKTGICGDLLRSQPFPQIQHSHKRGHPKVAFSYDTQLYLQEYV